MNEHEYPDFDLEDILREFGEEDLLELQIDTELPPQEKAPETRRDTIRLDSIQEVVKTESVTDDTVVFQPISDPQESWEPVTDDTVVMDLSDVELPAEWEAAVEDANDDYQPPQPIIFHPKSRLRELRQKLVAGPEHQYYALTEQGTGKLQAAILLSFLLFLASGAVTGLYCLGMVAAERMRFVVFTQILLMMLSALLGCYRLMEGIGDVLHGRFTLKTLLVFTFGACCADAVLCLQALRMPCSTVFCLEMLFVQMATCQKRSAQIAMMDTLRKATNLYSVVQIPNLHESQPGYCTGEGQVEDFMDHYDKASTPETVLNIYGLVGLLAAIGLGIWAGVSQSGAEGARTGAAVLLIAVPASALFSMSRPLAILQKRLHKLGTVLCGWHGIKGEKKAAVFPVRYQDLFPAGSVKLNGVKFYGSLDTDTVIAYTATMISKCGSGLDPLFDQLLKARGGYRFRVSNYREYESGGVGGEMNGQSVLVGSMKFMREMGVEMPEGNRVAQAVYTAVDGTLCGVFAVAYTRTKAAFAGLHTLCGYRKIKPVLTCNDFLLTESFLRAKFRVKTKRMHFLPDQALAEQEVPEDAVAIALTVRDDLAPKAFAVTGARQLRAAWKAGTAVHMLGGIVGLLMAAALVYSGAFDLLTAENLLLYHAIWLVPGWLITEWTRHI